jgi:hypothetical protein
LFSPAQRTAVQLRPHQQNRKEAADGHERARNFTTGEREDGAGQEVVRPSVFNGLLGGAFTAATRVRKCLRLEIFLLD